MNNTSIIQSEYFEQNSNLDINNKINNNNVDFINEEQTMSKNEDLLENSSINNINLLMSIHDFNILPEDNNNDTLKNISIISQYQPSEPIKNNNKGSIKELGQGKNLYL
jgi:hypothetical protein